jgi:PKD repeat protein
MKAQLNLVFLFLALSLSAQKEYANWKFGWYAGLNFLTNPPTITSGSTSCAPATATQSDSLGNLLFYTQLSFGAGNDLVLFNKNNDTLANGGYLIGSMVSQAVIIVPRNTTQYYVIANEGEHYALPFPFPPMTYYSIVDMSLASGSGSVVVKNVPLSHSGTALVGKMAVTRHCNGKDYWLLMHGGGQPGNNLYYSYLITAAGISTVPVITSIGAIQPQGMMPSFPYYLGQHKFSPNGRKLAATMPNSTVELYDFNTATGHLSNVIRLDSLLAPSSPSISPFDEQSARGLEFSPDGSKLYVSYINKHPHLCQFDLSLANPALIKSSKTIIKPDTITSQTYMYPPQLAYDGKIYVVSSDTSFPNHLHSINSPNLAGAACGFNPGAIYFGPSPFPAPGKNLANTITSFFEQKPVLPPITASIVCGTVQFSAPVLSAMAGYSVVSYSWNFNDVLSATNTSTLNNPTHQFSANGSYTIKLALNYHPCGTDTLKQVINITGLPEISISGKTTICKGESTVLSFSGASAYTINTTALAQTTAQVQPTITTVYTVTAKDNSSGCSSLKTLTVNVLPCVGLSENTLSGGLKLFPNPNSGVFTFETPEACEIKIHNSLGQEVYRASITAGASTIDISREAKGIYLLDWSNKVSKGQFKIVLE